MPHPPLPPLQRIPLDVPRLRQARADAVWPDPHIVAVTGSTNADAARLADADPGAPEGTVIIAEQQTAGRGRLDRTWQAPASSGVLLSLLLRPPVEAARWTWLPLLAGVATVTAVRQISGAYAGLKWPNDLVIDRPDAAGGPGPRKLGGLLLERTPGGAAIIGIGLNVDLRPAELPTPAATSLVLETRGAVVAREDLIAALLAELDHVYARWITEPDDTWLAERYRACCVTLGRRVTVSLPDGRDLVGLAADIDVQGRLLVQTGGTALPIAAGDIVHLRT